MDKEQIKKAVEELSKTKERSFTQSYDLIINLRDIVTKQNPLDFFATLHYPFGRSPKIAGLVGTELEAQAKEHFDLVLTEKDFETYKSDPKLAKKLAKSYDYFVAQAKLMPKVAQAFGRTLGQQGKMPNPKLGCVVPPNANLESLKKKLQTTVRLRAKKATNLQCIVGKQDQPQEQIIDNIYTVYQAAKKNLPSEENNIKSVQLKLTMSPAVKI